MLFNCLLCNNRKYKKLYTINGFTIVQCEYCHLVFTYPWPNKEKLDEYYQNFDYRNGFVNELSIRQDAKRSLKNLISFLGTKRTLLDVGCGAGFLLDEARKLEWKATGLDTAFVPLNYAKNHLKLQIIRKDIEKYNTNKRYSAITLIQVIEHLINPYPTLRKIYNLLENNGIVCVATPNINCYLHKVLKNDFNYLIPPEHVVYYSPSTLVTLLVKSGFTIIRTITYGYSTDLAAIIKRLLKGKSMHMKGNEMTTFRKEQFNRSKVKQFKSLLFDKIFCMLFYPLVNSNNHGSMVEIYAKKSIN